MSTSSSLHSALDRTPNSSLHAITRNTLSVEDVILLIKGNHLSTIVVTNTFMPFLVTCSCPGSSFVVGLADALSVLHESIGIDTPNLITHTIDALVIVGIL